MRIVVAVVCLIGCNKKFDRDYFVDVCSKGTGVDGAAAYDPATPAAAEIPLAMIHSSADSKVWFGMTPSAFTKAGIVAPTADNYDKTQLAFCIEQQPGAFDRDCGMDDMNATIGLGDDSAKTAVKATGNTSTIKAYGSHYVLTVREAKTGKPLATKELDVKVRHCPIVMLGPSKNDYVSISDQALLDTLGPLLPSGAAARVHPDQDF